MTPGERSTPTCFHPILLLCFSKPLLTLYMYFSYIHPNCTLSPVPKVGILQLSANLLAFTTHRLFLKKDDECIRLHIFTVHWYQQDSRLDKIIKNLWDWTKKKNESAFIQAANVIQLNGILAKQIPCLALKYNTSVNVVIPVTDMAGGSGPVTRLPYASVFPSANGKDNDSEFLLCIFSVTT